MEFVIDFLCQITETEPKTAMAGPARNNPRRTWRNKPTKYYQPGSRYTSFCDNSQLYFQRRFTGGAMNKVLQIMGSGP